MAKFSPFKIISGKRVKSFWDMNDKQQREFVREILEEFQIEVNRKEEEKKKSED